MPNFILALLNVTRLKYPSPQRQRFMALRVAFLDFPVKASSPQRPGAAEPQLKK